MDGECCELKDEVVCEELNHSLYCRTVWVELEEFLLHILLPCSFIF